MRYRAFISYSHTDEKWARWLHRALESYRVPKSVRLDAQHSTQRLTPVFRDRDELPSSSNLSDSVNDALRDSDKLIVVCSPAAVASRWVNEEILSFRRLGRTSDILCLITDGGPGAGDETECLPPALQISGDDVGLPCEPVAADARAGADGRRRAFLKIVAGMLGVGFDALIQRDLRRRHKRLLAATAGSLVIAGVTITLAIVATFARQDAERRRTEAEDLIDYLLGDLTDRLYEIGRLDIYDSIGDEAFAYFAAQSGDDSERMLAQRAKSLRRIGEVQMDRANLPDALDAFQESLAITARLAARNDDAEAQIDHAHSHFYIGHVNYLRGDLVAARSEFELVLGIVNTLREHEPDNPRWLDELGLAYTNLGRVLELEGVLDRALESYERVMEAYAKLTEIDPSNEVWQFELGFAHGNIGAVAAALGRLDDAESHFRSDLDIKQAILDSNPDHNTNLSYLGVSHGFLGELLADRGRFQEAELELSTALDIFDYLLEVDPSRTNWQMHRANIERELGRVHHSTGRTAEGRSFLRSAIEGLTELVSNDEGNVETRRHLAWTLLIAADFETRAGEPDAARAALAAATNHLAVLGDQETGNIETEKLVVHADAYSAALTANDDAEAASALYRSALEALQLSFADSSDPRILALRLRALEGLGRNGESEPIRERLQAAGFQVAE